MPKFSVIVPWKASSSQRQKLWDWNKQRWTMRYGKSIEIIEGHDDSEVWSRGNARNEGVSRAKSDILILADADTVLFDADVNSAVRGIERNGGWYVCHGKNRYYNLNAFWSQYYTSLSPMTEIPEPNRDMWDHKITSWAGMLAVPREGFDACGGYDSRFKGWGYEDNAFYKALDTLYMPHKRTSGYAVHLWHPTDGDPFDQPFIEENRKLYRRYEQAANKNRIMYKLVNE